MDYTERNESIKQMYKKMVENHFSKGYIIKEIAKSFKMSENNIYKILK